MTSAMVRGTEETEWKKVCPLGFVDRVLCRIEGFGLGMVVGEEE